MITHTPCGGDDEFPGGRVYITLRGGVGRLEIVESERGRYWTDCDITATGDLDFELPKIFTSEDYEFEERVFHEIGHVIGIG